MRFQVPQFIEIEDKIFGPLSLKQFIYLAGSVGISVVFFTTMPTFLAFVLSALVIIFGAALAFFKYNSKPFIEMLEAFFVYIFSTKLYLWKRDDKPEAAETDGIEALAESSSKTFNIPTVSHSRLKDLGWELDTK